MTVEYESIPCSNNTLNNGVVNSYRTSFWAFEDSQVVWLAVSLCKPLFVLSYLPGFEVILNTYNHRRAISLVWQFSADT